MVPLLSPCPLSLSRSVSLSLTFVVKKLRTLVLFAVPAVEYIQHLPLFSPVLPSLTTRAAGVNEASLHLGGERQRSGRAEYGGVVYSK